MADTAVDLNLDSKLSGKTQEYQMDAIEVFKNTLVNVDADGYLGKCAAAASTQFAGITAEAVDNSGGSAGDLKIKVYRDGIWKLAFSSTLTIADVGDKAYAEDDQTCADEGDGAANEQFVGVIVEFVSANVAWVDISAACANPELHA